MVGTRQKLKSVTETSFDICGNTVPFTDTLKLLGATLDPVLSFDKHVSLVCSGCFFHIKALRHIPKHIHMNTANTIATAFIASKLDYCNAILAGMNDYNIARLQRVQNAAARAVLNMPVRVDSRVACKPLH